MAGIRPSRVRLRSLPLFLLYTILLQGCTAADFVEGKDSLYTVPASSKCPVSNQKFNPINTAGLEARSRGDHKTALICFEKAHRILARALATQPTQELAKAHFDMLYNIALTHHAMANFASASFIMEMARREIPGHIGVHHALVHFYTELNRNEDVIRVITSALDNVKQITENDRWQFLAQRGVAQRTLGDERALQSFQEALKIKDDIALRDNYAAALFDHKQFGDALNLYLSIPATSRTGLHWMSLIKVYLALSRYTECVTTAEQYLSVNATDASAWTILGKCRSRLDPPDYTGSAQAYEKGISLGEQHVSVYQEAATIYSKLDDPVNVKRMHETGYLLDPNTDSTIHNYANTLYEQGEMAKAVDLFARCLKLNPQLDHSYPVYSYALRKLQRYSEAETLLDRAVEMFPEQARMRQARALVYDEQGRLEDAIAEYNTIVAMDSAKVQDKAHAHNALGMIYADMKKNTESVQRYAKAWQLDPTEAVYGFNYANSLVEQKTSDLKDVIAIFDKALSQKDLLEIRAARLYAQHFLCEWATFEEDRDTLVKRVRSEVIHYRPRPGSAPPNAAITPLQAMLYPFKPSELLAIARMFAEKAERSIRGFPVTGSARTQDRVFSSDKPLSVALAGSDFRGHPVGRFVQHLFALSRDQKQSLPRTSRVDLSAVSYGADDKSPERAIVMKTSHEFVDLLGQETREAITTLNRHQFDVLVDLNGWTRSARLELFAARTAPIQVTMLGYPGTTGSTYIDYNVVDPVVVPPEVASSVLTEKGLYLSQYQVNHHNISYPQLRTPSIPSRESYGLPNTGIIFGNFNKLAKLTPRMFRVWMSLLGEVPNSVLWLLKSRDEAVSYLQEEARRHGIAGERLVFATPTNTEWEHLERTRLIDVFLDTELYGAHCTGSDALWSGVPLVTIRGPATLWSSRVAASLLTTLSMPELIASNYQEYQDIALRLAQDTTYLSATRAKLHSALTTERTFNTRQWWTEFTSALHVAAELHSQGIRPMHIVPQHGDT